MEITKRNGTTEPYDREKIAVAIRKSFASTGQEAKIIEFGMVVQRVCFKKQQLFIKERVYC